MHRGEKRIGTRRHTAAEFGQSFLELLLLVVGGLAIDRLTNEFGAFGNGGSRASAVHEDRVVGRHARLLRSSEMLDRRVFELDADFVRDHRAARQHCQILQIRFAIVAKAWCFHCNNLFVVVVVVVV